MESSSSSWVEVIESCFVAPRGPTPATGPWLSPLDLALANLGHTPQVWLYRSGAAFLDVPRLKEALAKALVAYYPLAGRLGRDDDGRVVEIRCCNDDVQGALFVVARSPCLAAQDVDFSQPSPELKSMFVPSIEPASNLILATQVTFLSCGAVVLGASVHHAAADGTSLSHFMQAVSALYRDDDHHNEIRPPCHDRTLLRARSPPVVHPDALSVLYYPKTVTKANASSSWASTSVTEAFRISRDQLVTLKKRLSDGAPGTKPASTFVSLSALVWQCMTAVRRLPPDAVTRLGFQVSVLPYVRPPLPSPYLGNAWISLCAAATAGEIAAAAGALPPSVAAARITAAMARMDDDADDDELVRSAIDLLAAEDDTCWPRSGGGDLPETDLRIISLLNVPLGMDLGRGGPQAMTRVEPIPRGAVCLVDDYGEDDDDDGRPGNHRGAVRVMVRMEPAEMHEFHRLLDASIDKLASSSKL